MLPRLKIFKVEEINKALRASKNLPGLTPATIGMCLGRFGNWNFSTLERMTLYCLRRGSPAAAANSGARWIVRSGSELMAGARAPYIF